MAVEQVARLKGRSLHTIEVTFAEPVSESAFAALGVDVVRHENNTLRLQVRDRLDDVIKTIARYPVLDLRTEQASLEDIFLVYYADEAQGEEVERVTA